MLSIHDFDVYAYSISIKRDRIVLNAESPSQVPTYIDVVFSAVATAQFDDLNFRTKQNILSGIYELEPAKFFREFEPLFGPEDRNGTLGRYRYFPFRHTTQEEFTALLHKTALRCFDVQSAVGLTGFVIAKSYDLVPRDHRAPDA